MEKSQVDCRLSIARDGQEAIDYLEAHLLDPAQKEAHLPSVVLLDLNMPRVNGFEVLTWVKSKPEFSKLPVIIFSTSDLQSDVDRAFALGASDYIVKPTETQDLVSF